MRVKPVVLTQEEFVMRNKEVEESVESAHERSSNRVVIILCIGALFIFVCSKYGWLGF